MRNLRTSSFVALLLLPIAAQALAPVGAPLTIVDGVPCSFIVDLEVIATPKGAVDVVWVDGWNEFVKSRRFGRDLQTGGPVEDLLFMHGGLNFIRPVGTWAGRYELALNVLDFGEDPSDPEAAYRMSLNLDGELLGEPGRFETPRFLQIAPAAGGDSLQFRFEPPYYGPLTCRSRGLLVSRIDPDGASLSKESRVTGRASGWAGGYVEVERQANDTFVTSYPTCEKFTGVVARRLNASGVPLGKPINLPFPARVAGQALALRGNNLAVAALVQGPIPDVNGAYTRAVTNGKVSDLHRIPTPAGLFGVAEVMDLAASSAGSGYLVLFRAASSERQAIFAQVLDAQGAPQGAPLEIAEDGVAGAVATLPDGRWFVVTRTQDDPSDACTEQIVGTVLGE